jgi:hypothetical protein
MVEYLPSIHKALEKEKNLKNSRSGINHKA